MPNERIIYGYDMHLDDKRISVSLATVEFKPAGKGTRLTFTEQGAFLDGFDDPKLARARHHRSPRQSRQGAHAPSAESQ